MTNRCVVTLKTCHHRRLNRTIRQPWPVCEADVADVTTERRCHLGKKKGREDRASSSCCLMTHNYCWRYNCHSAVIGMHVLNKVLDGLFYYVTYIEVIPGSYLPKLHFRSLSLGISFFPSFILFCCEPLWNQTKSHQIWKQPGYECTFQQCHFPRIYGTPEQPPPWYDNPCWDSVASRQQIWMLNPLAKHHS